MTFRALVFVPVLLLACAEPSPAPTVVETGAPTAAPSNEENVAAVPSASTQTAKRDAVPPMEYPDPTPILSDLCALARDKDGKVGCACCPPFEDCPAKGQPAASAQPAYRPDIVVSGHFSAPDQQEAVLGTDFACEENLSNYGHVVVARKLKGKWQLVDDFFDSLQYASTYPLPDGRELVVALTLTGKTPQYSLAVWDFAEETKHTSFSRAELFEWTTTAYAACVMGAEPGKSLLDMRVLGFAYEDKSGDGKRDLVVSLLSHEGVPNPAYKAACAKFLEEDKTADPAAALPERRFVKIFRFNGRSFEATR